MITHTKTNGDKLVFADDGSGRAWYNGVPIPPEDVSLEKAKASAVMASVGFAAIALGALGIFLPFWIGKTVHRKSKSKLAGLVTGIAAFYLIGPEIQIGDTIFPPGKGVVSRLFEMNKITDHPYNPSDYSFDITNKLPM